MPVVWLAFCLGVVSWVPVVAAAVVTGRLLAQARDAQTRPIDAGELSPLRPIEITLTAALPSTPDAFDAWAFAWADALS